MKAYKQIDLKPEKKFLAVYISTLIVICLMILISPVFADVHNPGIKHINDQLQLDQKMVRIGDQSIKDSALTQQAYEPGIDIPSQNILDYWIANMSKQESDSLFKSNEYKWFILGYLNGLFYQNQKFSKNNFYNNNVDSIPGFLFYLHAQVDSGKTNDRIAYLDFINRYSLYQARHRELLRKYYREGI